MTSNRPYLLRAIYEWLSDNQQTPQILVDTSSGHEVVPTKYIKDHQILLNIASQAVSHLDLGNEFVRFQARFEGKSFSVEIPLTSVIAIFSRENGQGMVFSEEAAASEQDTIENNNNKSMLQTTESEVEKKLSTVEGSKKQNQQKHKSKANLKIIK